MTLGRIVYLIRRQIKLGLKHGWAEHLLMPRISSWRIPNELEDSPVPVHVLTSRYDWEMALWMLASLHEASRLRWPIVLHEDGTLEQEQLDLYAKLFPSLKVVRRTEADLVMGQILGPYPRCADYRNRMPHGLKAFDIPQLANSPRYLMLDPDVLFFSRPTEIVDWAADSEDFSCWFNQDFQEPSPIPPAQAEKDLGIELWSQVNTGLCLLTRDSVSDLAAMEEWLAHPALQDSKVQWRVEQTLLALAASKAGKGGLLPSTYEVSPNRNRHPKSVARHYVGCVRDRFIGEGVKELSDLTLISKPS
jgi:hypothetical protein